MANRPDIRYIGQMLRGQSSSSLTLCTICNATKNIANMFISKSCSHAFCTNCISNYIESKIQSNIANVKCPGPNCKDMLDPQDCSSLIPKQLFERWDDKLMMQLSERMEWRRCSNCKIYVEKIAGCVHMTCRCGFEFCYRCGCKWSDTHESGCVAS